MTRSQGRFASAFLLTSILSVVLAGYGLAETMQDSRVGASLVVPAGWTIKDAQIVPPAPAQDRYSHRKIHLQNLEAQAASPRQALDGEMDRISARSPNSTNGRSSFLEAVAVKTRSGLIGLRGTFGSKSDNRINYQIIKYYFVRDDGSIFKVCAHVYGDYRVLQGYETIVLEGLTADSARPITAESNDQ